MSGNHEKTSLKDLVTTSKEIPTLDTRVESFRCVNCNRFLGYVALIEGTVAIKCRHCKTWSILDVQQRDDGNNPVEGISQETVDKIKPPGLY